MPVSASPATRTGPRTRPPEATPQSVNDPACTVCPHPVADHDAVGLRFCRATRDAAHVRGCVCQPA
jgi:hypothetical protein